MTDKIINWISKPWCALTLIFLLTFVAYSNIFPNQFYMDDFDYVVHWPLIRDWGNLPQFFGGYTPPAGQEGIYSPFKTVMHAVNYHLFGLNPFGHHVYAIINYFMGITFVYMITQVLCANRLMSFLCALLFAVHPVHGEYVYSITGSVDALGVNLLFLSFYLYVRAQDKTNTLKKSFYIGALAVAFISIYLHELCLSLPLFIFWYEICFLRSGTIIRKRIVRVLPFFGIAISYVIAKHFVLGSITRGSYIYGNFYLTMLVMIKAWAKYVYIMFAPYTLTMNHVISRGIYSYDQEDFDRIAVLSQSIYDGQVLLSLMVLGFIGYYAWKNYKETPLITFCIGWFFIGLLPGANIVPSSVYFAERYLYPGSFGFCLLFAWWMNKNLRDHRKVFTVKIALLGTLLIILITGYCIVRVWIRNLDGRNEITMYQSLVRENPHSALMRTDLGLVYLKNNQPRKAMESLQRALDINRRDPDTYILLADAYLDLYQASKAIEALNSALIVDPHNPVALYNLGQIYDAEGNVEAAKMYVRKAIDSFYRDDMIHEAQEIERVYNARFGESENKQ